MPRVLLRPHDAARSDDEWRAFLRDHDFGQLVAPGAGREVPVIVPTHFAFDGRDGVLLHLARQNPVWAALEERPLAVLTVIGAYSYIPTTWNAAPDEPPGYGVPTSYYANVQATCRAEPVDDAAELAAILAAQLAHHEPDGPWVTPVAGDNPFARQFPAIRGLRLTITDVRAKFKFGGNRPLAHRLAVAERLRERGEGLDLEAREHLLRRSEPAP